MICVNDCQFIEGMFVTLIALNNEVICKFGFSHVRINQSFKFRSVPAGTAGIFRSVPKTGTEHVIKNFALCIVLFQPEWPELPESGRNGRNGWNRGINFSVLKFICLFCIFLY